MAFLLGMIDARERPRVEELVWGVPFDAAVSNRPGARFGPQGVRRASAIFDGDPQYPFQADPFEHLAVIDYGDCSLDYARHAEIPRAIEAQAHDIIDAGPLLCSIGGVEFVGSEVTILEGLPMVNAFQYRAEVTYTS